MSDWQQRRKDKAAEVELGVRAGKTLKELIYDPKTRIWSPSGYRKHCRANPAWSERLRKAAWPQTRARIIAGTKAVSAARTHCKNGHEFTPENTRIKKWSDAPLRFGRACRQCARDDAAKIRPMTVEKVERVKALILQGVPLHHIGGAAGKGGAYVTAYHNINYQRTIDPEFDRLVGQTAAFNRSLLNRPQHMAYMRRRCITMKARREAEFYQSICTMIPAYVGETARDDIVQSIMMALIDKSLRRDQVKERIKHFVTEQNRLFPPKFAKFGGAQLLSLDAVLYEDGNATRHDTVSEGLWT